MSQIKRICDFLFHANVIKTIIFNFRMLPFKQAIRLPIWLYGRVVTGERIRRGKIILSSPEKLHFGGIKFGYTNAFWYYPLSPISSYIEIQGVLRVGERANFGNGTILKVLSGGVLEVNSDVNIGGNAKIYCQHSIYIGEKTMCSGDCTIIDTNFHYYKDNNGELHKKWGSIYIGSYCWLGHGVTINKDSFLPKHTIVASHSLINKNYSHTQGAILAGIPAKVISEGNKHVWNVHGTEWKLDAWFVNHPNKDIYDENEINIFD